MNECRAFRWVGQSLSSCDDCGRDIVDHDGLDWLKPGAGPTGRESETIPFEEAERRIPLFAHQVVPMRGGDVRRYHESQRGVT